MITLATPETWQDLQSEVARLLAECGFAVEVEKTIQTPRGTIELDVLAEETVKGRRYALACECKHWRKKIPQTIVHAFRTVVTETGANVGYLISLEGFQSGSYQASEMTNLELVTWAEFQNLFERTWFESFFIHEIDRRLDSLMSYTEPFAPAWWDRMSGVDQDAYVQLQRRHFSFGALALSLGPYTRMLHSSPPPELPLRERLVPQPQLEPIPDVVLDATAYRELLDAATYHGEAAIAEFEVFRARYAD